MIRFQFWTNLILLVYGECWGLEAGHLGPGPVSVVSERDLLGRGDHLLHKGLVCDAHHTEERLEVDIFLHFVTSVQPWNYSTDVRTLNTQKSPVDACEEQAAMEATASSSNFLHLENASLQDFKPVAMLAVSAILHLLTYRNKKIK